VENVSDEMLGRVTEIAEFVTRPGRWEIESIVKDHWRCTVLVEPDGTEAHYVGVVPGGSARYVPCVSMRVRERCGTYGAKVIVPRHLMSADQQTLFQAVKDAIVKACDPALGPESFMLAR
jgi:hypothetical protein